MNVILLSLAMTACGIPIGFIAGFVVGARQRPGTDQDVDYSGGV